MNAVEGRAMRKPWPPSSRAFWLVLAAFGLVVVGCGGGGGGPAPGSSGTQGSGGAGVTAPVITAQPLSAARIVGQAVSITVSASGADITYAWETSSDAASWTSVPGAHSATLHIDAVDMGYSGRRYRAKVSNAAGTAISDAIVLNVAWGEVVASADIGQLETSYGGGDDGSSPGGGDGAGVDGGGGLGKVLNARMTVTRVVDGALIGNALTHPFTGLVKIKAGPGAAPLLLTLRGEPGATYYDEGKRALVPLPDLTEMRALVDRIDENLAVSPLTEAAYRYAINNFVADPAQIASGRQPLLRTAGVASLSAEQIRQASERVRAEFNRLLPQLLKLPSIKALPTPLDDRSPADTLKQSRYGLAAIATGALVRKANDYLPSATAPAVEMTEQFARDMTDGKLDGYALDGTPAAQVGSSIYYDVARPAVELGSAGASISQQFGTTTTLPLSPRISDFTVGSIYGGPFGPDYCAEVDDNVALLRDGRVNVLRELAAPGARCLRDGTVVQVLKGFIDDVRFLRSISGQVYAVKNDGTVHGWGSAICGRLGEGSTSGRALAPVRIDGIVDITSLATGNYYAVARDKTGAVYTWGSDLHGVLGLGPAPVYDVSSCDVFTGDLATPSGNGAVLRPRRVPGLSNIVSVASDQQTGFALDAAGKVYHWGQIATPRSMFDQTSTPTLVAGLSSVVSIATAGGVAFALRPDGTVWGWGANNLGNFGDGSPPGTVKLVPEPVPGLSDVVQLAGDSIGGVAALLRDGTVRVWDNGLYRTPTTPQVAICLTPYPGGGCTSSRFAPFPKMRHVAGNGFAITMIGVDGTVYWRMPSTNELLQLDPAAISAPS
ncbi:MAG: hypothetical protein KIT17_00415 [Rubrivivax sp.]|nr:hypothetical protein [Rubrivivax sp.]